MDKLKRLALDSISGFSSPSGGSPLRSYGSSRGTATDFRTALEQALVGVPPTTIAASAAVATVSLLTLLRLVLYPPGPNRQVIPGPLTTVYPSLSKKEQRKLQYQPDQFEGARDVATPYGSIRVYEWGNRNGPRVLFIHGISTPCLVFGKIAHGLVKRGYRVMLFDLFGRGFSDGVGDIPHDARLYVSQALLAMSSSTLPWTGKNSIRVIGYSMGASIAIHLASTFPHMVSSMVLIAPTGFVRTPTFGFYRFLLRLGLVPEYVLSGLARQRLRRPLAAQQKRQLAEKEREKNKEKNGPVRNAPEPERLTEAAVAEAADPPPGAAATPAESSAAAYVRWMVDYHAGFVPAYLSCIRYAPLGNQHEAWKAVARRDRGSTFVILGKTDDVIDADKFTEDALPLIGGKSHVRWKVLAGGHDLVATHSKDILHELDVFWGKP